MSWVSFVDYMLMIDMGAPDSIARNYDLNYRNPAWEKAGEKHTYLLSAHHRMGLGPGTGTPSMVLADIRAKLRSMGYRCGDDHVLENRINAWYIWDRLRSRELMKWRLKPTDNPLFG